MEIITMFFSFTSKRNIMLIGILISAFVVTSYGQPVTLRSVSITSDSSLKIHYLFSSDVSNFQTSRLNYQTTSSSAAIANSEVSRSVAANGSVIFDKNRITYDIPFDKLSDINRVDASITLLDSKGSEIYTSPETAIDISQIRLLRLQKGEFDRVKNELEEEKRKNVDLGNRINSLVARRQATQIEYAEHVVSHNRIAIRYVLNNIGAIRVTLSSAVPGSSTISLTSKYSDSPVVEFTDLSENREYSVRAEILDIADPSKTVNYSNERAIRTESMRDKLNLTNFARTPSADGLVIAFNSDEMGVGEIEFCQRLSDFQCGVARMVSNRKVETDTLGRQKGLEIRSGKNEFVLDGAVSGKSYKVIIRAFNRHGRLTDFDAGDILVPEVKKLAFETSSPLSVDASPLGITLSWKANFKPRDANFIVTFDGNGIFTSDRSLAKISESGEVSITLPVDEFARILANTNNPQKKNVERPRLRAQMTDESNNSVWQELRFSYSLPTKTQIAEARQKNLISEAQKKEIENVVDNTIEGRKVDWSKIFKTGLSIFLKLAL